MAEPPLPWDSIDPNAEQWTVDAYDMIKSGALKASMITRGGVVIAVVNGKCPRCGDDFSYSQIRTVVTEQVDAFVFKRNRAAPKQEWVNVDVRCRCVAPHPSRPTGQVEGCGAAFTVPVLSGGR